MKPSKVTVWPVSVPSVAGPVPLAALGSSKTRPQLAWAALALSQFDAAHAPERPRRPHRNRPPKTTTTAVTRHHKGTNLHAGSASQKIVISNANVHIADDH
jgi:hypothetical protein